MISLNWSDVISVLNMCKAYLIAIATVILIGTVEPSLPVEKKR